MDRTGRDDDSRDDDCGKFRRAYYWLGVRGFRAGVGVLSIVGMHTHQTNLLATNGFLTLVNLIGVWRWLGRQRVYEDGGKSATRASQRSTAPNLFTATGVAGMPIMDSRGEIFGKAVEALLECHSGGISYVVVATNSVAGVDEKLRAIPRDRITFQCEGLRAAMTKHEFSQLPILAAGEWPPEAGTAPKACA